MSPTILYQSAFDNALPFQQLGDLNIAGLSTRDDTLNTDCSDATVRGVLYGSFTLQSGFYTLNLYKDITKLDLVASASSSSLGMVDLVGENGSNLSGTVNFAQYIADDTAIKVICFLSCDDDLPMSNLEGLSDYDATNGFVNYHLLAFKYLTSEFIVSKYKSKVWNNKLITTNNLNGALGGYDLSKCLNLDVLREASAHYAFSRLAERAAIDNNTFERRAKESKGVLRAHLQSIELTFDEIGNRVETESRAGSTFKIGRC
jgi:hypothetical protein